MLETTPEILSAPSALSEAAQVETPAIRFEDFGLSADILRALTDQGYIHPTPIQAEAIPIVLQGRDVMGAAQTGTGKTAGFALPIIQILSAHANTSASPARHPVRALILTPTRELAVQVADNVKAYAEHTSLRVTVVFGGVDIAPQTAALRTGVEIVIATPGRLLDHVQQKTLNLSQVQMLVMDEADRMLDMGFLPDLQRIINLLPKQRQNLMFSATFSNEIKKLANSFLTNPAMIEVARGNSTAENLTQIVYKIDEAAKGNAVSFIIRERGLKQAIVFSNSKIGASRLARQLVQEGIDATAIHGDKTQAERMAALEAFKQGKIAFLIATDVAARGLDIVDLPCVINYDLPFNAEDYVHRIGRTARAGASGDAISLYSDKDERLLVDIEKLIKRKFERQQLVGFSATPARSSERAERTERAERIEKPPRREDSSRTAAPQGRSNYPAAQRREKLDPWFLKPYEPAVPTANTVSGEKQDATPAESGNTLKPKLAVLLGGTPSSWN